MEVLEGQVRYKDRGGVDGWFKYILKYRNWKDRRGTKLEVE